jgi:hypothetical protein
MTRRRLESLHLKRIFPMIERRSLAVLRAERRQGRTKKMTVIAIVLMLLALVGYVLSNDESTVPGEGGEEMRGE